jgi:cytochrome oxidase Cu insertion factor (SCO1/SenC/PrrC family)
MHRDNLTRLLISALFLGTLVVSTSTTAQTAQAALPEPTVKVGDTAPDFTLRDQNGKQVKLSDFRGKENVVLAFYVFAFTGG